MNVFITFVLLGLWVCAICLGQVTNAAVFLTGVCVILALRPRTNKP